VLILVEAALLLSAQGEPLSSTVLGSPCLSSTVLVSGLDWTATYQGRSVITYVIHILYVILGFV